MCIDDIEGSSLVAGFEGCTEVVGVSHAVTAPVDASGAIGGASCSPYVVNKSIDASSARLLNRAFRGASIDAVVLSVLTTGSDPIAVFELTLRSSRVVHVAQDFSSELGLPFERVELLPAEIKWRFTPVDGLGQPDGDLSLSLRCGSR